MGIFYRIVPQFLGKEHLFLPTKQNDGAPIIGVPVCPTVKEAVLAVPTFIFGCLYRTSPFWVYKLEGRAYPCVGVHDFHRTREHRFMDATMGVNVAMIYISQLDCLSCGCEDTSDCITCEPRFIIPENHIRSGGIEIVYPYRLDERTHRNDPPQEQHTP